MTRLQQGVFFTLFFAVTAICGAETTVSGDIGTTTWTRDGSPYIIDGEVRVLPGETLTIGPGVRVETGQLTVNGKLVAAGGPAYDIITFASARIVFNNAQASQVNHTVVQDARATSSIGGGVLVIGSAVSFKHCILQRNTANVKNKVAGGGIAVIKESTVSMDSCRIWNNEACRPDDFPCDLSQIGSGGAVYCAGSHVTISNSTISGNESGSYGGVINGLGIRLINCYIANNTMKGRIHNGYASIILARSCINCTIADNRMFRETMPWAGGGKPSYIVASGSLTNCIVWGNDFPAVHDTCDVRYSNLENSDGTVFPGEGNICTDPLFTNPDSDDYSLQDSSPCINSGDPATPEDLDGTVADMGVSANRPATEPALFIPSNLQAGRMPALLEVYNPSRMAVTIDSIQVEETFHVRTTLPFTLQPGATEYISFDYKGSSDTTVSAVIHWTDTEARSSVVILHGTRTNTVTGTITSTTWTKAASPYVVIGQCIVPAGEELTIEPGVTVSFNANVPFLVQGRIRAEGSEAEKIRFQRGETDWAGIRISGSDSSSFSYVVITGGQGQADADRSYEPYGGGVNITGTGTRVSFDRCTIRGNHALNYWSSYKSEYKYNGFGGGLSIDGDVRVWLQDCLVAENHAGEYGSAICVKNGAQVMIDRCLFYGNATHSADNAMCPGKYWGVITLLDGSSADISNTTLTDNDDPYPIQTAIRVLESVLSMTNSIVWDAGNIGYDTTSTIALRYCNVESFRAYGRYDVTYPTISEIDGVGNISLDPLFADTTNADYRLLAASPCIDAGDPALTDPGGSRSDMGVMWYGRHDALSTENRPLTFTLSQNMPNPFNPATTIPYSVATAGPVSLNIYNLQGQLVKTLVQQTAAPGEYHATWNGRDMAGRAVASGVYVYRLSAPDGVRTKRMLLVR